MKTTYLRRAHYHETDQMGIIHHSNYVKWMEEARIEFMDAFGFGFKQVEQYGIVSPVVEIAVEYKRPVKFDDTVAITVWVRRYNGAILEVAYEFVDRTTNEVCTTASSKHCFTKDGQVVSLKHTIPDLDRRFRESVEKTEKKE